VKVLEEKMEFLKDCHKVMIDGHKTINPEGLKKKEGNIRVMGNRKYLKKNEIDWIKKSNRQLVRRNRSPPPKYFF
jgi:hypothetical protein